MGVSLGAIIMVGLIAQLVAWRLHVAATRSNNVTYSASPRFAILVYAAGFRLVCWVLVYGLLALFVWLVFRYWQGDAEGTGLAFGLTLSLLICTGLLLVEVKTRKVIVNDETIASLGRLGETVIHWAEIDTIYFNRWLRTMVIKTTSGKCLRINPSLSGIEFLEFMVREKLEGACYAHAFHELKEYRTS